MINDASLVMIPSGYKDGTLYSVKPTNGDGDFTFSRGSNLAATRVNSEGLIEKGRENLLLQSNSFDTTWSPSSSITLTGGQTGYDGSSDAWLLKRSDASARYINQSLSLGQSVYTYSVYAKAESVDWLFMWTYDGSGSRSRYFDLANGVVGATVDGTIDVDIESVGNGWYRCSITYDDSIIAIRLYPAVDDGSITGGISPAGIYIQDAQLELGLVATEYIETTTTTAQAGILEDMPRLNYGTCPSLLLEPQRTNLIQSTEYFNSSYWIKSGAPVFTITDNAGTSPEGVSNASRFVAASSSASTRIYSSITWTATPHTISVYVKNNGGTNKNFRFSYYDGSGQYFSPTFTLTDEWQRVEYTFTPTASAGGFWLVNSPTSGLNLDLLVYGAQLESGSYPTSYIPTYGSSVTRSADSCSKTGISSLIGQSEGTLFFEFQQDYTSAVNGFASLSDGSSTNRITVNTLGVSSTDYTFSIAMNYSGSGTVLMDSDITYNDKHKAVIVYSGTTAKMFIDGSQVDTNTTTGFGNYDRFILGQNQLGGSVQEERELYNAILFPTALSDAECIALTTL